MNLQTQFSIFLVNKPGVLASITDALAQAKINVIALTLMDSAEHGVLRLVTDAADKTRKILKVAHDQWTESEVLVMDLNNKPGSFAHIANTLAENHVNISYAYCTGSPNDENATGVFKVADVNKTIKLLTPADKSADKSTTKKKAPTRSKN